MNSEEVAPCGPHARKNREKPKSEERCPIRKTARRLCEFRCCSAMHLHTLASPWHQKDWQPSHTSHGAHHIVKHLSEQRGGILHEFISEAGYDPDSRKKAKYLSQLNWEYLIMWFIERDLDCITNIQFTVGLQYISQPHDSARRMYDVERKAAKKCRPNESKQLFLGGCVLWSLWI